MNTQKILATVGILAALVMGFLGYTKQASLPPFQAGAVPTLDGVDNPFVTIGGYPTFERKIPMSATSSVVCTIKNPFNATSTLVRFGASITTGILGTNAFSLSTTTGLNGFGSSTPSLMRDHSVGSNTVDAVAWYPSSSTSTPVNVLSLLSGATGESFDLIAPNEWVVYRIATTTSAGALATYYTGSCDYLFQKI